MRPPIGEREKQRLAGMREATSSASWSLLSIPMIKNGTLGSMSFFPPPPSPQWRGRSQGRGTWDGHTPSTPVSALLRPCLVLHCTSSVQFRTCLPGSVSHHHTFSSSVVPDP